MSPFGRTTGWLLAPAFATLSIPAFAQPLPSTPVAASAVIPIRASKIVLIGDSTMAVIGGWGPGFCSYVTALRRA